MTTTKWNNWKASRSITNSKLSSNRLLLWQFPLSYLFRSYSSSSVMSTYVDPLFVFRYEESFTSQTLYCITKNSSKTPISHVYTNDSIWNVVPDSWTFNFKIQKKNSYIIVFIVLIWISFLTKMTLVTPSFTHLLGNSLWQLSYVLLPLSKDCNSWQFVCNVLVTVHIVPSQRPKCVHKS